MATIADSFTPNITDGSISRPPMRTQTLAADGAITIAAGVVFITKATAAAITIDDPPTTMDGAELRIVSTTAAAHTVTNTTGFGGGTTTRDVATWGGAISDGMVLVAKSGVWYVSSTRNVTIA
jgi:hypothetical protein